MIKPDWNIFRAKFNDNPQSNFEWLCYLSFCREFKKHHGVPGYKNQRYIEHDPIQVGDEIIGWQAKFIDTTLSNYTADIIELIEGVQKDFPNITRIIFYSNQNWGQGKDNNDPKSKIRIDNKATELGVCIDWEHLDNFFKSDFFIKDNKDLAEHFFLLEKSIYDVIKDFEIHSKNILLDIRSSIEFKGKTIEIDRKDLTEQINNSFNKIIILSGEGGVGKTAIIKNLFDQLSSNFPFYIFKATEFELRTIDDLFKEHSLQDFINAHQNDEYKFFIIDSAEKLLDLKNFEPFKELLTSLSQNDWTLIFTTRNNYKENLNYEFFEIYNLIPITFHLRNLTEDVLIKYSSEYNFELPVDLKLLELIKTPFYLNEYLKFYTDKEQLDYESFKDKLWIKKIKKGKASREQTFLNFSLKRADEGHFFVKSGFDINILDELKNDGILGYEIAGYFITHDIYEEWALEKIIQSEFEHGNDAKVFLTNIGISLPMRRSFRNWISKKLLLDDKPVQKFIENVVKNENVDKFWKTEIFVAILLSNYSEIFFTNFKNLLLENNLALLKNLCFLLRVACKEVDIEFFNTLGIKDVNIFTLKYVLTKPKGNGWESLIKFVHNNLESIGLDNVFFILPIISDWNNKFTQGVTTRYSSIIALKYYEHLFQKEKYLNDENYKELFQTILHGANEITEKLKIKIDDVIKNKWKKRNSPYYTLSKSILTKTEASLVAKVLPNEVLQLAKLFWRLEYKEKHEYRGRSDEIDEYFDIEEDHFDYYPPSAFQTPIYWLLDSKIIETLDFILEFTNESVKAYMKSHLSRGEANEIQVYVGKGKYKNQYSSERLWGMYRGTQVGPNVLSSMLMALEKYLLKIGKNLESEQLEFLLLYLLEKTNSVAITSIITSIVVAYHEKAFNMAAILFETKDFFFFETRRYIVEQTNKSQLLSLSELYPNARKEFYDKERIKACDDPHRQKTLENIFLEYQFFRSEKVSDEDSEKRTETLWKILDKYYNDLPPEDEQTEEDQTWRFYLARMDRRKMNPQIEETDKGFLIQFNPEIEPSLKKATEESQNKINLSNKFISLRVWASLKLKNDEAYKKYEQYEDPKKVFQEMQDLINLLIEHVNNPSTATGEFYFLNYSIPREVCSLLIRDNFEQLNTEEQNYCVQLILDTAISTSKHGYKYQILDRVDVVYEVLPIVFKNYPQHREAICKVLIYSMFNEQTIDLAHHSFNMFAKQTIQNLWDIDFNFTQSILVGYVYLRIKYDEILQRIRNNNQRNNVYGVDLDEVWKTLEEENKDFLEKLFVNNDSVDLIELVSKVRTKVLINIFLLLPYKAVNSQQKELVKKIISIFSEKMFSNKDEDRIYLFKFDFFQKLSYLILNASRNDIEDYLQPLLSNFKNSENAADLFDYVIYAEDRMHTYDNFWIFWLSFKEKVIEVSSKGGGYGYIDKIIRSYLFGGIEWKEDAMKWHSIKENDKVFFDEMVVKLGHCSVTLYSFAKFLNGIGNKFLEDGIDWLATLIEKSKDINDEDFNSYTIYYLERVLRKYIYQNRIKIKKNRNLNDKIIIIADFLILQNSVIGYILKESII